MKSKGLMTTRSTAWHRPLLRLAIVPLSAAVITIGACAPIVETITDYRGYLPRGEEISKSQVGLGKTEVEALLGSPSTTATLPDLGESYYYISSVVETHAFLAPKVVDREILAVRFDYDQRVSGFAHYGLEDGKIINFIDRETPTRGKEMTILQQLFENIGRFDPGAGAGVGPGG